MPLLQKVYRQVNKNKNTENTCNPHSTLRNSWSCPCYIKSTRRGTKTNKTKHRTHATLIPLSEIPDHVLITQSQRAGEQKQSKTTENKRNFHSNLRNSWSCPHYTNSTCWGTITKPKNPNNWEHAQPSLQENTMQLSLHFQKFIGYHYHLRHAHKHFKCNNVPQTQHFALYFLWILPELLVSRWGLSASQ